MDKPKDFSRQIETNLSLDIGISTPLGRLGLRVNSSGNVKNPSENENFNNPKKIKELEPEEHGEKC